MDVLRKRLSHFFPISDEMWEDIESQSRIIKLAKGDFLLREGDICRETYFIKHGLLRMYYLKDGVESIRQFFFENGLSGDFVSAFTQSPTRLNFDVLEDTEIIAMSIDLLHQYPRVKEAALTDTLFHVSNRLSSIFLDSPEEKYRELIKGRPKVIQRIPQYMIASYIGVTPEGLSRIKKRIAKEELGK